MLLKCCNNVHQHVAFPPGNPFWFPTDPLVKIVKDGRAQDRMFENCWRHYCSEGWGGSYELDPEMMPHHGLVQFVM